MRQVLLKSPYARAPRRPTRGGAINRKIKNLAGSSSPASLILGERLELRPPLHDDGSRGLVKYDLNQLGPTGFDGPHRRPSGSVSSLTSCSCGNVNQPKGEPPPGTSHCTQQPLGELVTSSCRLITLTLAGPGVRFR